MVSVLFGGVLVSRAVPCVPTLADGPSGVVSALRVLSGCLVQAPNCCFSNPFLGAIRGGTIGCSSLTSLCVRGAGWFCLWALDLVELVWVSEVVEALFRCGPASPSHYLTLRWFRSHVGRSGVGPQFDRTA
ncbi:hypothetical protein Taro_024121, partial [Colocasia esculenta]|nr:hypothetical protein [Colocasia esculenta]